MRKNIRRNFLLQTDAYNLSHPRLKVNMDWEVSHLYNRKAGMFLFGLQEIVNDLLSKLVTEELVDDAARKSKKMGLDFPKDLFLRVARELGGKIPLRVQALPEGTWCPIGTPFAQVSNTVEGFGELVTWWEGKFLKAYYPSMLATRAYFMRKYLDDNKLPATKIHSFGFRGHRSDDDADIAAMAWNLSLVGTDDIHSIELTPNAPITSIAALAHKVTQQFNRMTKQEMKEHFGVEVEQEIVAGDVVAMYHAIRSTAEVEEGIVALVLDTYDAYNVINNYVVRLARYAELFDIHIVFRPDSGKVLQQAIDIYRIVEANGLKNVSVIIGEGMSFAKVKEYDEKLKLYGVPLDFVSYGVGGGFYNDVERDSLGWAMKTAYSNGENRMKYVKDAPMKRSIPGKVQLHYIDNVLTVTHANYDSDAYDDFYRYRPSGKVSAPLDDWDATKERMWKQDTTQKRIVIGQDVQDNIAEFAAIYGG
jgi:nicotinamide phosphoribosyltransferase